MTEKHSGASSTHLPHDSKDEEEEDKLSFHFYLVLYLLDFYESNGTNYLPILCGFNNCELWSGNKEVGNALQ